MTTNIFQLSKFQYRSFNICDCYTYEAPGLPTLLVLLGSDNITPLLNIIDDEETDEISFLFILVEPLFQFIFLLRII